MKENGNGENISKKRMDQKQQTCTNRPNRKHSSDHHNTDIVIRLVNLFLSGKDKTHKFMNMRKDMHCDDKRTLAVLKENIITCFNELKDGDYNNKDSLKKLNDSIAEYNEYKRLM